HPGNLPGVGDPPKELHTESAVNRRDGHRNQRLPPVTLCPDRSHRVPFLRPPRREGHPREDRRLCNGFAGRNPALSLFSSFARGWTRAVTQAWRQAPRPGGAGAGAPRKPKPEEELGRQPPGLQQQGFVRLLIDGRLVDLAEALETL